MMLNKIITLFSNKPFKHKGSIEIHRPLYIDRHKGRDFLVLATGPSLKSHRALIQSFIETHKPVVMAGNFVENMFTPDYHAFINRRRFCSYSKTINPSSKVLLSPYFTDHVIKSNYSGKYEEIAFKNIYPSDKGHTAISDGIINAKGATIATLLISVSIVMGANNVHVAGLDGYSSKSERTHHYVEPDNKTSAELLQVESVTKQLLDCSANLLKSLGRGRLTIITPTVYQDYYLPIEKLNP
ncbi:MAG TPA: DUF115 domain-containing protein [Elusimicrobiota bacterium]|nr:DUF115 domain-containing protein [Elusimicrobiota bacterium]